MRTVICPQNSPCFPVLLEVAQWNKSYSEVDTRGSYFVNFGATLEHNFIQGFFEQCSVS